MFCDRDHTLLKQGQGIRPGHARKRLDFLLAGTRKADE